MTNYKIRYKKSPYWNAITLILLVNKGKAIQQCEIFELVGNILDKKPRKATIFSNLKNLHERTIIDVHRVEIKPRRRQRKKYRCKELPKYNEIDIQLMKTSNYNDDPFFRYEKWYKLNKNLSQDMEIKLKRMVSEFYGFKSWFDLYHPYFKRNSVADVILNVRNKYRNLRKVVKSATEYNMSEQLNISSFQFGSIAADENLHENARMEQMIPKPRCINRNYNRLRHLQPKGTKQQKPDWFSDVNVSGQGKKQTP